MGASLKRREEAETRQSVSSGGLWEGQRPGLAVGKGSKSLSKKEAGAGLGAGGEWKEKSLERFKEAEHVESFRPW